MCNATAQCVSIIKTQHKLLGVSAVLPMSTKFRFYLLASGTAAKSVRQQRQQDKGTSASANFVRCTAADRDIVSPLHSATMSSPGNSGFTTVARHAQEQLDAAHLSAEDDKHCALIVAQSDEKNSGTNDGPVSRRMRASGSFQRRLSPSVPMAPSRNNSGVNCEPPQPELAFVSSRALHGALAPSVPSAPSRRNSMAEATQMPLDASCMEPDDEEARVHFDKYADPHTYDVPPPATPHPSKGVLNPPQSPRSPTATRACESSWCPANAHPSHVVRPLLRAVTVAGHLCLTFLQLHQCWRSVAIAAGSVSL